MQPPGATGTQPARDMYPFPLQNYSPEAAAVLGLQAPGGQQQAARDPAVQADGRRRLTLPPGNGLSSHEFYLQKLSERADPKHGFTVNARPADGGIKDFPYHDPAMGCDFRYHTVDVRDQKLLDTPSDLAQPFGKLLEDAQRRIVAAENSKRNRRMLERAEHQALQAVHLEYLQAGYDEVEGPLPFQHNPVRHPAMVTISPDPEYHGLAYWLS